MMTPRQQQYYEKIKDKPVIKKLIDTFDAVPVPTEEYKRNEQIRVKVDALIEQMELAPKEKRHVIKIRKPWDEPDLSWVKPGEVPF